MAKQIEKLGNSVIVYDDQRVSQISPAMFEPDSWQDAEVPSGQAGRQGAVYFVRQDEQDWALRHYYRGGMTSKLLTDQYLWLGSEKTRSFREWDLLQLIQQEHLPGPVPVAARYVRRGFWYTADLITLRIPNVLAFSSCLQNRAGEVELWASVGKCIARFHQAGFYHADLNAHNLQVDSANNVWLLDWDRGTRRPAGNWRDTNLARLQRSCRKISRDSAVNFALSDWDALLQGYHDTVA